jgi:molybdopterin synthase sulfur carrier subunit
MKAEILAFGIAREIVGAPSFSFEIEEGTTVNKLRQLLEKKFPELKALSSFRIAIDSEFAQEEEPIHYHSEIAIIPPVSGG